MALLFLVCACAGSQAAVLGPGEQALGRRLEAVLYRGAPASRVADLRVARSPGGAVWVERAAPPAPARDDAAVAADVRARLVSDPMLLTFEIGVEVQGGVARLTGALERREQAARAVLAALGVRGVRAVETTLTWIPPQDLARLRSLRP